MCTDSIQMSLVDQAAHVVLEVWCVAEPERLGAANKGPGECLEERLRNVDAFGCQARLASVDKRRPHRAFGRSNDVCVVQDQHGVLAAELQGTADQPLGALGGHRTRRSDRTGEAHVVTDANQLSSDHSAASVYDLP